MSSLIKKREATKLIRDGLWTNNPIFVQVLGICSTLAVTNLVMNTVVMCAALVWTVAMSSLTVSLLRNYTPRNVRMMVETLIIAFYVILVDLALKAYWPQMSENLGAYVGLVITNCIVMGRTEAYGMNNRPVGAFVDGAFNALGYSFVLLLIAVVREAMGMGTLLGWPLPLFSGPYWDKWIIMVMPPGAFFMLAMVGWMFKSIQLRTSGKEAKKNG